MIEYPKFKSIYIENIYSLNNINEEDIENDFNKFNEGFSKSKKFALSLMNSEGFSMPEDAVEQIRNKSRKHDARFIKILEVSASEYLASSYDKSRLDNGGVCLKSNLIDRACQIINNEDMLGVIRSVDEDNSRYLHVDFGDEAEVKIDIDELIISGQKR